MPKHSKFCETKAPLEILMPGQDRVVDIVNWQETQRCLFTVYADLEAINVSQSESCSDEGSKTREIERQYPASYGAVQNDMRGEWFNFVIFNFFLGFKYFFSADGVVRSSFFCGQNCIDKLFSILHEWTLWCKS